MKSRESVLRKYKSGSYEYIYIYYRFKDDMLRINTGNKYVQGKMNKDLTFSKKMEDYEILNRGTENLKKKVDTYIQRATGYLNGKVNQKECLKFIEDGERYIFQQIEYKNSLKNKKKSLIAFYDEFYELKKLELNNRASVKDYLSLKNAILDYQKEKKIILKLDDINSKEFLLKFREYLSLEHDAKAITRGMLNDNTIQKRFVCIKTFVKWLENHDHFKFKPAIFDFKLDRYDNDIIALTKADIQQLVDLKIENKNWQKIVDVFVFNCFCGLRYSDMIKLNVTNFIKENENDFTIIQENKKTNITVNIPIQQTSLDILKKYDYKLPAFSSQYFNRELKKILKEYELFPEIVVKKKRILKENKDYQTQRRDLISSHTCRRTFVTLAIGSNVPLNVIMSASGHVKLQTLKKYTKLSQDREAFKKIDLNQ